MKNTPHNTTHSITRRQLLTTATTAGAALITGSAASLALADSPTSNVASSWFNVNKFGLKGDEKTDDAPALKVLLKEHPSGGTFYFPPGKYLLEDNIDVPENIGFVMDSGAMLQLGDKSTFTMNGTLQSSLQPIFSGAGKVRGALGKGVYYPQWWGAKTDGKTDCAPAIDAAVETANASGGGTVVLHNGVYLLETAYGEQNVFITPRSNVAMIGEGDGSVLKAGDNLNEKLGGWNVIFTSENTPDFRVDNALFRDFKVDCNGANNLQTEGKKKFKNAAIGIRYGSRITVDNVTVENNAGRQCFMFGQNIKPQSTSDIIIRNCRVHAVGGGLEGNTLQNDHSVVYLQCERGQVINNHFTNPIPDGKGTAFEIHSSNCVMSGNVVQNFSKGINIVATVTDQINSIYSGNIFSGVEQGAMIWIFNNMLMDNVVLCDNIFEQRNGYYPVIDASVNVKTPMGKITVDGNILRCVDGDPKNTGHGVTIGNAATTKIHNNTFENLTGRALTLGNIGDKTNRILIENNLIENCCKTTKNGYHTAIDLNQINTIALLQIRDNTLVRTDETAMNGGISGNAKVLSARIENNVMENIPQEIDWDAKAEIRVMFVDHCGNGDPENVVRASPGSSWINVANGTIWRKTGGDTSSKSWTKV